MEGDVPGNGLRGKYRATLNQCANDCEARKDCQAFEHSKIRNSCKLLSEKTPTRSKCGDYHFCSSMNNVTKCKGIIIDSIKINKYNPQKFNV